MSVLIVFISVTIVVCIALYCVFPAVATIVLAPFMPFITAYRIRKESPVKSVLLVSVSILILLATLLLWFIQING